MRVLEALLLWPLVVAQQGSSGQRSRAANRPRTTALTPPPKAQTSTSTDFDEPNGFKVLICANIEYGRLELGRRRVAAYIVAPPRVIVVRRLPPSPPPLRYCVHHSQEANLSISEAFWVQAWDREEEEAGSGAIVITASVFSSLVTVVLHFLVHSCT